MVQGGTTDAITQCRVARILGDHYRQDGLPGIDNSLPGLWRSAFDLLSEATAACGGRAFGGIFTSCFAALHSESEKIKAIVGQYAVPPTVTKVPRVKPNHNQGNS